MSSGLIRIRAGLVRLSFEFGPKGLCRSRRAARIDRPLNTQHIRPGNSAPPAWSRAAAVTILLVSGLGGTAGPADVGPRANHLTVAPGAVVHWMGVRFDDCRLGDLSWGSYLGECWYPVDLRSDPGTIQVERIRGDASEYTNLIITSSPYPIQKLTVAPKMVDPPADELDRIRAESRRIRGIWHRSAPANFRLPLHPPITPLPAARSFGSRRIFNGENGNPHSGVDFSASTGTPVLAAASGIVVIADGHYYSGNSVFIDHGNDLVTMYFHLDTIDIEEGQPVLRGETIGTVGSTGRVTGPHLHFGIRWHGARVDPTLLLGSPEAIPTLGSARPTD